MILQGIRSMFGEGKYRLLIGCPPSPEQEVIWRAEVEFFNSLLENPKVAGVIVWDTGNPQCSQEYQALISAKIPLVFVDREPSVDVAADVVAANNRRAAQRAVQHLTDLGHERIAMVISSDPASTLHDRFEGYSAALKAAGIRQRPEDVVELPAHWPKSREATEELLIDLLRQQPPITAIFAATDRLALNILEASKSLKVSIPERMSLVGFDWLMRWLPSGGELTSVNQPFEEIGRAAATAVLEQINATEPRTPRHILLDAPLVVKHSTAAPFSRAGARVKG
jgi:DNA-binding LacI/PurR family transcriptional regulator